MISPRLLADRHDLWLRWLRRDLLLFPVIWLPLNLLCPLTCRIAVMCPTRGSQRDRSRLGWRSTMEERPERAVLGACDPSSHGVPSEVFPVRCVGQMANGGFPVRSRTASIVRVESARHHSAGMESVYRMCSASASQAADNVPGTPTEDVGVPGRELRD